MSPAKIDETQSASESQKGLNKEKLKELTDSAKTKAILADLEKPAGERKIGIALADKLAQLRLPVDDKRQEQHLNTQRNEQYAFTFRLKAEDVPEAYKPFLNSYFVQLGRSLCETPDEFDKFIHLSAIFLRRAEAINKDQLAEFDRERNEPLDKIIGQRQKPEDPNYLAEIQKKCQLLEVVRKRYAITEVEGNNSFLSVLKQTVGLDINNDFLLGTELRKDLAETQAYELTKPRRKDNAPPFGLFPIQEKAFSGTPEYEGMLPYLTRTENRGSFLKIFDLILPTGVGKTLTAAELVAKIYQQSIGRIIEARNLTGNNETRVDKPPALLFIAPQRVLVTQAAKSFHSHLSAQYGIQVDSSIVIGGQKKETNWAFVQRTIEPYKAKVQDLEQKLTKGEHQDLLSGPLQNKTPAEIKDLLLTYFEDILQLDDRYETYHEETLKPARGDAPPTEQEKLLYSLKRLVRKTDCLNDHKTHEDFDQNVQDKFLKLGEDLRKNALSTGTSDSGLMRRWENIKSLYQVSLKSRSVEKENGDEEENESENQVATPDKEITPNEIALRIRAQWNNILSPFKVDDPQVNALRAIVKKMGINVPPMYSGLMDLTLDCQNGMIKKPDPQDYTFEHLENAKEQNTRRENPLPATFSTIQALYNPERLNQILEDLSEGGTRKVVVVFDEAHHIGGKAKKNVEVQDQICKNVHVETVIGMTASEVRADGQSVTDYFQRTVFKATLLEAVKDGRLNKFTYLQPRPNLDQIKGSPEERMQKIRELSSKKAEKSKERLQASVNDLVARIKAIESIRTGTPVGEVFPDLPPEDQKHWEEGLEKYWSRQVLGFCNDRASAEFVVRQLKEQNVSAAAIFGDTPADQRAQILKDYNSGKLSSIILVGVGREGLDLPKTTVGVLFGSVGSAVTLQQIFGRFLRLHEGPPTLILDYSVPASQEYHAELMKRQFAVDVVGQPPKESARDVGNGNAKGKVGEAGAEDQTELLSTIQTPTEQIVYSDAKTFTSKDIQFMEVEKRPENFTPLASAIPAPVLAQAQEAVQQLVEEKVEATPFLEAQTNIIYPTKETLEKVFARGSTQVEADLFEAEGETRRVVGKVKIGHRSDQVDFNVSFAVSPSSNNPVLSAAEITKRTTEVLARRTEKDPKYQDWTFIYGGSPEKGRGMITFMSKDEDSGEEKEHQIMVKNVGKNFELNTNLEPQEWEREAGNINDALSVLMEAAIGREGILELNADVQAICNEKLSESVIRVDFDDNVGEMLVNSLKSTLWVYYHSAESREKHPDGNGRLRSVQANEYIGEVYYALAGTQFGASLRVGLSQYSGVNYLGGSRLSCTSAVSLDDFDSNSVTYQELQETVKTVLSNMGVTDQDLKTIRCDHSSYGGMNTVKFACKSVGPTLSALFPMVEIDYERDTLSITIDIRLPDPNSGVQNPVLTVSVDCGAMSGDKVMGESVVKTSLKSSATFTNQIFANVLNSKHELNLHMTADSRTDSNFSRNTPEYQI